MSPQDYARQFFTAGKLDKSNERAAVNQVSIKTQLKQFDPQCRHRPNTV